MGRKVAVTIEQRKALRKWAHNQHPKPTQQQCQAWFTGQFHRDISQSTISESLSKKFRDVDDAPTDLRNGQWPELEKILWNFQQRIEQRGGFTSGDVLREHAKEIWNKLPQYKNMPCPSFSNGWLQRFKARHGINEKERHGEAASIPAGAEEAMAQVRAIAHTYGTEDIYNMDETGLFWKMMPSRGLSSQNLPGVKKNKIRITAVFCVNGTGSDRLPIWFAGKFKTPRALRNINLDSMGAVWRYNQASWMTSIIMEEWLLGFYRHIGNTRRVLLTMDNFSGHVKGVESMPPPPNITIIWLPPNSTSQFQPLDQGIISATKAYYKKQWLAYMLKCYRHDKDPAKEMHILHAIQWLLRAWNQDIGNMTIYNCFRKSTLLSHHAAIVSSILRPQPTIPEDLPDLYRQVVEQGNIRHAMSITNFLNLDEENLNSDSHLAGMNPSETLDQIILEHLPPDIDEAEAEEDEPFIEEPARTHKEAHAAIKILSQYFERQDTPASHMRSLERLSTAVEKQKLKSIQQTQLDQWLL